MELVRLPVGGAAIAVRQPEGTEEMLLAEATRRDTRLAVELLSSAAVPADPRVSIDWSDTAVTDVAAALMHVRRVTFGDTIRTTAECPECGKPIDVSFRILDFLRHREPRRPKGVTRADDGWLRLDGKVRFRIPTARDRMEADLSSDPERELARRCIPEAAAAERRRAERALAALAPAPATELDAHCPECASSIIVWLDAQSYCLEELAGAAASVFADVHLLAETYSWPEATILELPRGRRARYAEMIRDERRPA